MGGKEIMTSKMGIPCEFKYELAMKGWASMLAGFLYVIRDEFDAITSLKLIENLFKRDDRLKNLTNFLKTVFKIEGNDIIAIKKWFDIWYELTGFESTLLEQSETIFRIKITTCPFKTGYKDISGWCKIWSDIVLKTINPKATFERPKGMCAGDPHCEYIFKLEE